MRDETNMLLMSPLKDRKPHSTRLHQLYTEIGKIITEWKFAKDGANITMRDITNDGNKLSLLQKSYGANI